MEALETPVRVPTATATQASVEVASGAEEFQTSDLLVSHEKCKRLVIDSAWIEMRAMKS